MTLGFFYILAYIAALNFKEIPYEIKPINLLKSNGEQFSEEFLKVNPMAKVPALQIDNQTLIESVSCNMDLK